MSDELTELPEGWKWTKLGDVLEVIRGASPRPKGDPKYFGGTIPWIMIADVSKSPGRYISQTRDTVTEAGALKSRYLKAGTLILSNSGTVCVPKILAVDGCIHDGFVAFPDLPENIDIFYLYEFFTFIRPQIIEKHRQGVTQVNLNTEIVRSIDLILPPINEQKRIVAKIEELRDRLHRSKQALEAIPELCDRFRQSVLAAAFRGDLTADWREENPDVEPASVLLERIRSDRYEKWKEVELSRMKAAGKTPKDNKWKSKYKEPANPDSNATFDIPESWAWASLECVCPIFVDCAHRTPKYSDSGIPALRPRDVVNGCLNLEMAALVSEEEYFKQTERRKPEPGDIIYSRELSFGWAVVIPENVQVCMSQGMVLFRPFEEMITQFIIYFLNGPLGRRQSKASAVGTAHPHINLTEIKAFAIPIPPVEEQKKIIAQIAQQFEIITNLEKLATKAIDYSGSINQSILAKAFRGELVDQDPNDEPASVLLDRIRAERQTQGGKKSGGAKGKRKKASSDQLDLPGME